MGRDRVTVGSRRDSGILVFGDLRVEGVDGVLAMVRTRDFETLLIN
jgi:hypothetical protein